MAVFHVVDVAQELQFVIHSRDDSVQAVSDESDLLVVVTIGRQGIDGDSGELGEVLLDARSLLEEPFINNVDLKLRTILFFIDICFNHSLDEDGRDHGVAVIADVFPASLDIADLVEGQFSLGINQILRVPE